MLAILTEEQELLASTVHSLGPSVGITNPDQLPSADPDKAWHALADLGLLGLRVREDGAPAASGVEAMIVSRELGAALSVAPFIPSSVLATELLAAANADPGLIDAVASGTKRVSILLDAQLSGVADLATATRVVAWGFENPELVIAVRDAPAGPQVVAVEGVGAAAPAQPIDLTARVTAPLAAGVVTASRIGEPVDPGVLRRVAALGLALVSSDCAGAMRAALDGVVEYSKHRSAYGAPIGSYQALQHMCADAFVKCDAADTANNHAAWAIDALAPAEALLSARTAKAWVASVGRDVTEVVMQVYGGIGQTWEHIAHLYARRAIFDTALFGDADHQLSAIFRLRQEMENSGL